MNVYGNGTSHKFMTAAPHEHYGDTTLWPFMVTMTHARLWQWPIMHIYSGDTLWIFMVATTYKMFMVTTTYKCLWWWQLMHVYDDDMAKPDQIIRSLEKLESTKTYVQLFELPSFFKNGIIWFGFTIFVQITWFRIMKNEFFELFPQYVNGTK